MKHNLKPFVLADDESVKLLAESVVYMNSYATCSDNAAAFITSDTTKAKQNIESILYSVFSIHFGMFPSDDLLTQISKAVIFIAKDHCFVDGNKRTAVLALETFTKLFINNNASYNCSQEYLAVTIQEIAKGNAKSIETYISAFAELLDDLLVI